MGNLLLQPRHRHPNGGLHCYLKRTIILIDGDQTVKATEGSNSASETFTVTPCEPCNFA